MALISIGSGLALAAVVLVAWYIGSAIRTHRALRDFGGHWSAGWSRLWLLRTVGTGHMNVAFTELNRKYGSTARIGPRMLITSDPDLLRRMNAARSDFTRSQLYQSLKFHPDEENILSLLDDGEHAEMRRRLAPGYAGRDNDTMESDIDQMLLRMLRLLDDKYVSSPQTGCFRRVDLSEVTSYFTLDTLAQISWGQPFGFMEANDDFFGYVENMDKWLPAALVFGICPELLQIMKIPLVKAMLPKATDPRGLGPIMGFAYKHVDERLGDKPVERRDMLGSFVKQGLTRRQLEAELITQVSAGSDTTASALRTTLHFICTNPRVLARLLREIEAAIAAGKISRPVIRDAEARQLPYLQACIKEGLRMYPPLTALLAKQVPPKGAKIMVNGRECFAPPGTSIAHNAWGAMRVAAIFGDDVEMFRPERWLARDGGADEQARLARMNDTVGLCFGYGRYGCLGRGVAIMEINKVLVETLLRYELQPCSLMKPFGERIMGLNLHTDMHFVVTHRRGRQGDEDDERLAFQPTDAGALPGAQEA